MNEADLGADKTTAGQAGTWLEGNPPGAPVIAHLGVHPEHDPERAQLPPKARFTHAYKHGLLPDHASEDAPAFPRPPQGTAPIAPAFPHPAPATSTATASAAPFLADPSFSLWINPTSKLSTFFGEGAGPGTAAAPRRQLEHPLDLGEPGSNSAPGSANTRARSPNDSDSDDAGTGAGADGDPLHRGAKAARLSTSKIHGRAEPRKPRIGPQFQAFVPPWTPGL